MSIDRSENKPIETRLENAIEVALPFVDDFSQNSESGETIELEVWRLSCVQSRPSPSIIVHLPTRKPGKTDLCPNIAARTFSRVLGKRINLRLGRKRDS